MNHRILIFGLCVTMAACSAGTTKTVTGTGSPTTTAFSSQHGAPPTLSPNAGGWYRSSGIINGGEVAGHDHACVNSYGDPYRGGWVSICAGGKQTLDSAANWVYVQGGVWVGLNPDPRVSGPDNNQPAPDSVDYEADAPNSPTWVKMTSVTGDIVSLQRQDGSTLAFNLQTRQFS